MVLEAPRGSTAALLALTELMATHLRTLTFGTSLDTPAVRTGTALVFLC